MNNNKYPVQWVDTTDYKKRGKNIFANHFTIRCGLMTIIITNIHPYHRPDWVLQCFILGIDSQVIKDAQSIEDVKQRALDIVGARLDQLRDEFIKIKRTVI